MKQPSSDSGKEITIQYQFDCFCRKVLRGEANTYRKEMARYAKREISFSALSQHEMNQLSVYDEYCIDKHTYHVLEL